MYFFFQHGSITLGEPTSQDYRENVVEYGAIPYEITHPGAQCTQPGAGAEGCSRLDHGLAPTWLTIFTAMFMHGGLFHLAGNMLFLWIFGNNIEDSMGRLKFIAFYLIGGLIAVLGQTIINTDSTTPTIGASGAVAAVLGGYALLYPRARVLTLVFIIFFVTLVEIPAMAMLGIWFVLQFIPAIGQVATPDVAGSGGVAYF